MTRNYEEADHDHLTEAFDSTEVIWGRTIQTTFIAGYGFKAFLGGGRYSGGRRDSGLPVDFYAYADTAAEAIDALKLKAIDIAMGCHDAKAS